MAENAKAFREKEKHLHAELEKGEERRVVKFLWEESIGMFKSSNLQTQGLHEGRGIIIEGRLYLFPEEAFDLHQRGAALFYDSSEETKESEGMKVKWLNFLSRNGGMLLEASLFVGFLYRSGLFVQRSFDKESVRDLVIQKQPVAIQSSA